MVGDTRCQTVSDTHNYESLYLKSTSEGRSCNMHEPPKNSSFTFFIFSNSVLFYISWILRKASARACSSSVDTSFDQRCANSGRQPPLVAASQPPFLWQRFLGVIDLSFLPLHSSFDTLILQRWPRQVGSRQDISTCRPLSFIIGSNMDLYDSVDSRPIVRPGYGSLEQLQISKCG
jgi:hypothetical protein